MKYRIFILILSLLLPGAAYSTEVDDTSNYYVEIKDSEVLLNAETQRRIDEGLSRHFGCNRKVLGRQMASFLVGNLFFGTIEDYAVKTPEVDRSFIPTAASIYKGTPYDGGFVDTFVSMGSVLNVAGYHVGTDKLGHFMDMGWDLYGRAKMGQSVSELLAQSRREQSGLWGKWMTGVKSYGDIASNFDGYRFWTDLIDEGPNNFFVCENGRFKQVRAFRWADYVSAAWTEAINCSEYASQKFRQPIHLGITALESREGKRYACPIEPARCAPLRAHYARWIPESEINQIISPACK